MEEISQLKVLQDIEYEALVAIKKICDENGISFFLRGGSVLGAVKYGNFVPWDDDIDIAFPREDYMRLIKLMPTEFGENFRFVCYQNTENAHCYFPRILLSEKRRMELKLPTNNERGLVLIDVLPLDGMPDLTLQFHILKAYTYRVLASLWTMDVKETVSMHKRKQQKVLELLYKLKIHHLYKQDTIYKKMDKMYSKYPFGGTRKAGMIASSKLKKEIVPTEWWGNGKKVSFRDLDVLVPSNYDAYLKQLFGENYASYEPPVEDRKKSHLYGMRE